MINNNIKHVFEVSSHSTFLIVISVQHHLKIKSEDIYLIFLNYLGNSFYNIDKYTVIRITDKQFPLTKWISPLSFFLIYFYNYFYRHKVKILNGNHFHFYSRGWSSLMTSAFLLHKRCKEIHLIEDGLFSYLKPVIMKKPNKSLNIKQLMKNIKQLMKNIFQIILNLNGRLINFDSPLNTILSVAKNKKQKIITCYTFSDFGFQHYLSPFKKTVLNVYKEHFNPPSLSNLENNSVVIVLGPELEMGSCLENNYFQMIDAMIVTANNKPIYLKFHRRQTKLNRKKIISYISDRAPSYKILNDRLSLEVFLLTRPSIKIYVFGSSSSLLLYTKLWTKNKVLSFSNYLSSIDNTYKKNIVIPYNFTQFNDNPSHNYLEPKTNNSKQ